jgi:hypothetical protein
MALAGLALYTGLGAWGQDSTAQPSSGQSLGDVARKTRQEYSATGHVAARQRVNEEDDSPDRSGVWRVKSCTRTPCYQLSITLPKNAKWTREKEEPRPVLIPLAGHEDDPHHAIRVYAAESLGPAYSPNDIATRTFLQGWFARPEYFGQAARLVRLDHAKINNLDATIAQFTVQNSTTKYRGLSVAGASPYGNYAFACVFCEEDAGAASSICDAVIKSAAMQTLQPRRLPEYQEYSPQPDDPPDDAPDDSDPQ